MSHDLPRWHRPRPGPDWNPDWSDPKSRALETLKSLKKVKEKKKQPYYLLRLAPLWGDLNLVPQGFL